MGINFGRLNNHLEEIEIKYNEAKEKILNKIPINNLDIIIADDPYSAIPEIGIGGYTHSPNFVVISLNPEFPSFKNTIEKELIDTLAHEFHHAARWRAIGYGETLLEAMISEGLADHFAMEVTKKKYLQPWDKALSRKQIKSFMKKAKKEFHNKNYSHKEWFFGSKNRGIPKWTAYALGFYLINNYLKNNPNMKASKLYSTKTEEFIE